MTQQASKRDRISLTLLFFITLAAFAKFAVLGLDILHDGTVLKPAMDVAAGQTIFRDSFSQYGPLTTWLQALAIWIVGPPLLAIKLLTVFFYALIGVLLFHLWRMILDSVWAWTAFFIWLCLAPFFSPHLVFLAWSSVPALFFQLCSAWCFFTVLRGEEAKSRIGGWLFFSGLSAAFAFWCRMPVGALTLLGLGGVCLLWSLAKKKGVAIGSFLAGALTGLGGVLLLLWRQGSLQYWYEQTIVYPARWAGGAGGSSIEDIIGRLMRFRQQALWLMLALVLIRVLLFFLKRFSAKFPKQEGGALIAVAATAAFIFSRWPGPSLWESAFFTVIPLSALFFSLVSGFKKNWLLLGWLALVLSAWPQFFPMGDARHLYWAIAPGIGLFIFWIHDWLGAQRLRTAVFSGVWLFSILSWQAPLAWRKLKAPSAAVDSPVLAGIRVTPSQAAALNPLTQALAEAKLKLGARPVVFEGVNAFYATLGGRLDNSHRMHVIWPGLGLGHETHFDASGIRFTLREKAIIVTEYHGLPVRLPAELKSWKNVVSINDPDTGPEISLWLPPD